VFRRSQRDLRHLLVRALSQDQSSPDRRCYLLRVKLADRVAQCRVPLAVQDPATGRVLKLSGAADCSELVAKCPIRFVLSDELIRVCTELAYSRGARNLACADLIHVPAQTLWMEWCNGPWQSTLERYGFPLVHERWQRTGRRGALLRSSPDGRRGIVRTLWTGGGEFDVFASSIEAYFDLDTAEGDEPASPDTQGGIAIRVYDRACKGEDMLARCFRFRYEQTWCEYYASAGLSGVERDGVLRHVLGTIAIDIPVLLAFLLLLSSRTSLPRRLQELDRLNRNRQKCGRAALLDHIEVRAPVLPEYLGSRGSDQSSSRRGPRLHHVRGHLARRGSNVFWRVPHLRGSARSGVVRTRTVIWTFDDMDVRRGAAGAAVLKASRNIHP
jgi:hypothetical protein